MYNYCMKARVAVWRPRLVPCDKHSRLGAMSSYLYEGEVGGSNDKCEPEYPEALVEANLREEESSHYAHSDSQTHGPDSFLPSYVTE